MRRRLALGAVAIALSAGAAATHSFTAAADVVTALGIGAIVVLYLVNLAQAPRRIGTIADNSRQSPTNAVSPSLFGVVAWALLAAAVIGFELANYLLLPRHAHPTLSSFLTVLAAHAWTRGLCFVAWLALGARIAWR